MKNIDKIIKKILPEFFLSTQMGNVKENSYMLQIMNKLNRMLGLIPSTHRMVHNHLKLQF